MFIRTFNTSALVIVKVILKLTNKTKLKEVAWEIISNFIFNADYIDGCNIVGGIGITFNF